MEMTSRERVMAAFEHEEPDRVPAWCGSSIEFWEKAKRATGLDGEGLRRRFGDDFRRVFPVYAGPQFTLSPGMPSRTPFGIEREGLGYGQPRVIHYPKLPSRKFTPIPGPSRCGWMSRTSAPKRKGTKGNTLFWAGIGHPSSTTL